MTRNSSQMDAARASMDDFNRKLIDGVVKPLGLNANLDLAEMVKSLTAGLAQDTERWADAQNRYYRKQLELWAAYSLVQPGAPVQAVVEQIGRAHV